MKNRYIKQWYTIVLGLFLMGAANAFGQMVMDTAKINIPLAVDGSDLYRHGYNSGHTTGVPDPIEANDTVTVTSVMRYFVMPDAFYNKAYAAQIDYSKTNLTASKFEWTVTNGDTTYVKPNTTGTSPWIEIKWGSSPVLTPFNIEMVEAPLNVTCKGDPTKIPIVIIQKPEIMFKDEAGKREFMECVVDPSANTSKYPFTVVPVSATQISQSWDVEVTYTLTHTKLDGTPGSASGTYTAKVKSDGTFTHPSAFTEHGIYTLVITKVTDHISQKCKFSGNNGFILGGLTQETFVYSMLPQPKSGKAYHIPNNF